MKKIASRTSAKNRGAIRAPLTERPSSLGAHVCVQRQAEGPGVHPSAPSLVREVLNSPGQPLDTETRSRMEPRFGYDFSGVRVHTDEKAAESARSLNAKAYTANNHIAFSPERYSPGTRTGQSLLAHELTHVIQQASGPVPGIAIAHDMSLDSSSDSLEQTASEAGRGLFEKGALPQKERSRSSGGARRQQVSVQRQSDTPGSITSAVAGGLSAAFAGIGLIAAFQSAAAGERQAEAAEYQATGGFNFDSYSFGPFFHQGQTIPQPGTGTQGGPDEGADELPPIPLIHVVAGDANEAIAELTLRTNGKDILGGIVEQGNSRGYGGGPRGASGNLVFTAANQLANAGDVAVVALHFRGTNHPAGKPVQRFHGRVVLGANGVVYRVECSHTTGIEGFVADCNSERRPPIIVGSGRSALRDNPASGDLPSVRQRRASSRSASGSGEIPRPGPTDSGTQGPGDFGPESPNRPPRNRGVA